MKKLLTLVFTAATVFSYAQTLKTGDFHLDQDYKMSPNGTINLKCSDAKVFITGSDRTNVNIKIDREVESKGMTFGDQEFTVDITESSGNINVRERSSGSVGVVGYYRESYTIKIEAPKGASLVLTGDDGDYLITTINGAIDVELDDADIELTGCGGSDFRFNLDDGEVKMDTGRGSLHVDGDDTDIEVRNASFTKVSADIDDGDFVIETALNESGDYFINTQDGRIQFTVTSGGGRFDIRHDDSSVRADGSFSVVEESEDRSRYTVGNGNAKVDIRADDASIKLARR